MPIVLLTLVGFVIRIWKIGYGLPDLNYVDEGRYVYQALNLGGGDLNPHNFVHPTLYFYLCFLGDALFILTARLSGFLKTLGEAWDFYQRDPTVFYVIARGVSAIFGTLTIPLVYVIGLKLFNKKAGWISAFFLTFAFLHAQYSQVAIVDATLTFLITLSFLFAVLAYQTGGLRYFMLMGLSVGLSASTKYSGLTALMLGPLALVLGAWDRGSNLFRERGGRKALLFFIFFGLGFTIGTPFWIIDFPGFKKDLLTFIGFYKVGGTGHLGYEGEWNWFYYLANPLRYGLGFPLELAGWIGILYLAVRVNPRNLLFVAFPLCFFLIAGFLEIRAARYIIPMIPFLCLGAAALVVGAVWRWASLRPAGIRQTSLVLALLSLILVFSSLTSLVRFHSLKMVPETRILAYRWMSENLPKDEKMLHSFWFYLRSTPKFPYSERLDPTVFRTTLRNVSSLKTLEEYRRLGFKYLVLDEWHLGTVLEGPRHKLRPERKEARDRYEKFLEELSHSAELLAVFSPYRSEGIPFDSENVDFASRSLWKRTRLGPLIRIYRL